MTTLYEALVKISSNSIYAKTLSPNKLLKHYIYSFDEYGEYFTKKEYQAFQNTLFVDYAGVGMLLYQQKRGDKILCIPFSTSLKRGGIERYDELISVNAKKVKGKNFYLVSSWIRGKKNTSVRLKIKKPSGKFKTLTIRRKKHFFQSVKRTIHHHIPMIEIVRFIKETPNELNEIIQKWPRSIPLVIDLRGNGGGDLFSAIQSADIFLTKNRLITSIETNTKTLHYYAITSNSIKNKKIILLQDKFTASASEVFISALTQNHRATSIGEKSLGKGVAQKFMPLGNGDALLLTYGKIITPNKKNYHKKGLLPTSTLSLKNLLKER